MLLLPGPTTVVPATGRGGAELSGRLATSDDDITVLLPTVS